MGQAKGKRAVPSVGFQAGRRLVRGLPGTLSKGRLRLQQEGEVMSSDPVMGEQSMALGAWCLVSAIAAVIGVVMIGQASFEWVPSFDPPGWARILTGWMFPVGMVAAFILGTMAIKRRHERVLAIAGIILAVAALGIFVWMIAANPY